MAQDAIDFRMGGDASKQIAELRKVAREQEKVIGNMRKGVRKSKDSSSEFSRMGQVAKSTFGSMAAKLTAMFGAGGLVALGVKHIRMMRQEMKGIAKEAGELGKGMVKTLSGTGDIMESRKLATYFRELSKKTGIVSEKEALGAFGAVRGAMPTADLGRVKEITGQAVMGIKTQGLDPAAMVEFAGLMGEMGKLMPNLSAGDVADISQVAHEMAGRHGKKLSGESLKMLHQYVAAGGDAMDGLAMVLSSLEAGNQGEIISQIVDIAQRKIPNAKGKFQRSFAAAGFNERVKMMMSMSPEGLQDVAGTASPEILAMRRQGIGKFRASLTGGMATDRFQQAQAAAESTPYFGAELGIRKARVGKELALGDPERRMKALEFERLMEVYETQQVEQGASPMGRSIRSKLMEDFAGLSQDRAMKELVARVEAGKGTVGGGFANSMMGSALGMDKRGGMSDEESQRLGQQEGLNMGFAPWRAFQGKSKSGSFPGKGVAGTMLERIQALEMLKDGATMISEAADGLMTGGGESVRQANEGL